MTIFIVSDSTSDLSEDLIAELPIHIIPAILVLEGNSFEDKEDISRHEFYQRLPNLTIPPSTAAPSSGKFENVYDLLFQKGYQEIISIHAASRLSGIYNAAHLAAQKFNQRVHVLDSEQITLGLGFQVLAAAKLAIRGHPLDTIFEEIAVIRKSVRVFAMLDTLEYIRRSGRVSWAKARLGSLLRIKPFVELRGGVVYSLGQVRTRQKGIAHLSILLHNLGTLEYLAILHSNADSDARQILSQYALELPKSTIVVNVTPVIGTHVGPNGLGFAAVVK